MLASERVIRLTSYRKPMRRRVDRLVRKGDDSKWVAEGANLAAEPQ